MDLRFATMQSEISFQANTNQATQVAHQQQPQQLSTAETVPVPAVPSQTHLLQEQPLQHQQFQHQKLQNMFQPQQTMFPMNLMSSQIMQPYLPLAQPPRPPVALFNYPQMTQIPQYQMMQLPPPQFMQQPLQIPQSLQAPPMQQL